MQPSPTTRTRSAPALSRARRGARPRDPVARELAAEGRAVEAEALRGADLVPREGLEALEDRAALDLLHGARERVARAHGGDGPRGARRARAEGRLDGGEVDRAALRGERARAEDVLELAHVPGPRVLGEAL